jgi:protein-S-isoprenylcysteine O-methyltransferase Ste14
MALREEYEKIGSVFFKYRSYLPVLVFLTYILLLYIYRDTLLKCFVNDYDQTILALSIGIIGLGIRTLAIGYASPNTSGRNVGGQLADSINTTGLYSIVRHPLYLGNALMWLGISLRFESVWITISTMLFFWFYYEKIMFTEEEFLRKKFGSEYEQWANKTPCMIPNFRLWKRSQNTFSWKKVIRQENDGAYALIVILFIIEVLGDYFYNFQIDLARVYFIVFVVLTLLYLMVKFLKKKTKLLK